MKCKTSGKTKHRDATGGTYSNSGISGKDPVDKIRDFISGTTSPVKIAGTDEQGEFTGLFIFEFDEQGRIVKHVIEHTEEGGHYDRMTRVVSVTDWLFGQFNGKKKEQVPELAWCEDRPQMRPLDRRRRMD